MKGIESNWSASGSFGMIVATFGLRLSDGEEGVGYRPRNHPELGDTNGEQSAFRPIRTG